MSWRRALAAGVLGAVGVVMIAGCPQPPPPAGECAGENEACSTSADCCADLACEAGICVPAGGGGGDGGGGGGAGTAATPAKSITLGLVAIHDGGSENYNGDCTGCHGDRTDEVSSDGVTPTAHARMLSLFGEGNDRCKACHGDGPDFLAYSRGGVREQVNMGQVNCAACHGPQSTPSFYAG